MSPTVERMWWEGTELHTIEDGEHFIYENATITASHIEVEDQDVLITTKVKFVGARVNCEVVEVPYG